MLALKVQTLFCFLIALSCSGASYTYTDVLDAAHDLLTSTRPEIVVTALKKIIDASVSITRVKISEKKISEDECIKIDMVVEGFRYRIWRLIEDDIRREPPAVSLQKNINLANGLQKISFAAIGLTINDSDIYKSFSDIVSGIYIISMVLAKENLLSFNQKLTHSIYQELVNFDVFAIDFSAESEHKEDDSEDYFDVSTLIA